MTMPIPVSANVASISGQSQDRASPSLLKALASSDLGLRENVPHRGAA
jgi:hypothetical protein